MSFSFKGSPEVNRRHHQRPETITRDSLERTLGSWQRLSEAWNSIAELAKAAENWDRLTLAESKLAQCESEILRLEEQLHPSGSEA